ncbi:hypothetical protein D3C73_585890 [compost metagenome]
MQISLPAINVSASAEGPASKPGSPFGALGGIWGFMKEAAGKFEFKKEVKPIKTMDGPAGGSGPSGGLVGGLVGGLRSLVSLENAVKLIEVTMGGAMKEQMLKDMFIGKTGSMDMGSAMFERYRADAVQNGGDVGDSLRGTLALISSTQNVQQLDQLNDLVQKMSTFDTSKSGEEANAQVLKKIMGGDNKALEKNFNISAAAVEASGIGNFAKSGDMNSAIAAFSQLFEQNNMGDASYKVLLDTSSVQVETLGNTIASNVSLSGNAALQTLLPLAAMLNEAFKAGKFDPFFEALSLGLNIVAMTLVGLVDAAIWLSTAIQTYWPIISSILAGIATFISLQLLTKLWAMLPPLLATIVSLWGMVPALWAAVPALWAQAVAWLAINWPILLIAIAIAALVLIVLSLGGTFADVVGYIAGSFMVLVAIIWNIVAAIWNIFAELIDFLIRAFTDPVYVIKKLFYDLAMAYGSNLYSMLVATEKFAGGFMSSILGAVNGALKGFNWLSKKISDLTGINLGEAEMFDVNNVHAMSDKVKGFMDQLKEPVSDKEFTTVPRMDMKDPTNEFKYGFNGGSGLINSIKLPKLGGSSKDDPNDWTNSKTPVPTPIPPTQTMPVNINRVNEVGSINDEVAVSGEDLKIMRDLAEMNSIQNFVSLTPTVQVTTGDIRQESDITTIIKQIEQSLVNEIATSAQGVYG